MTDEAIAHGILKFMRQMHADQPDEELIEAAVARRWLAENGAPTQEGRALIQSFAEIERIAGGR